MSIKELYRDDLLNRYVSHTFTETVVGSMTLVEFKDGSDDVVGASQCLDINDAYRTIRQDLVGFAGEIMIVIDETQRDALTSTEQGTIIYNTDGSGEAYIDSSWDPL